MRPYTVNLAFVLGTVLGPAGALSAQQPADTAAPIILRGAEVYSRHCQRCHVPRSPGERDDRDWIIIMQHMQTRANLTRERARAALAFLLASNQSARRSPVAAAGATPLTEARITDAMIEQGRQVFQGQGGCSACHGADLTGGPIAPALADDAWKNGDGSPASILHTVRAGVDGTAMAGFPGGISDEEAEAVAAYVWAIATGRTSP